MNQSRYKDSYRTLRPADPARILAYEVLQRVSVDDAYTNIAFPRALREATRSGKGLSPRDAAFAAELVYGSTRQRGYLDWVIDEHLTTASPVLDSAVRDVLRLGIHQILHMRVPDHAAVAQTVDLARNVLTDGPAKMVNAVLRSVLRSGKDELDQRLTRISDETGRLAITYSHPKWIVRAFRDSLEGNALNADELEDVLAANNKAPLVTLVARPGLISKNELENEVVERLDARIADGALSPAALIIESGDPALLPSVRTSSAAVQDEGSQLAALMTAEVPIDGPDQRWLDLCAGPGGKAALLGTLAHERGAFLTANEVHSHRARLVERACAQLDNVDVVSGDGRRFGGPGTHWETGSFDRVLVDVPCSGLGSLRRRPEARWRRTPMDLNELVQLQAELLDRAIEMARSGGIIAYVTCSPDLRETQDQVKRALSSGTVELMDALACAESLSEEPLGLPEGSGRLVINGHASDGRTLQLWTHRHDCDSMFVALLKRI